MSPQSDDQVGDWLLRNSEKQDDDLEPSSTIPAIQTALNQTAPIQPAQNQSTNEPENEPNFRIGAVGVVGAQEIDISIFSSAIESAIGAEATDEQLASLSQEMARVARDRGYIMASTSIPEQAIQMGVVQVHLIEGVIDEVRIIGSENKQVERILKPLEGLVAKLDILERKLLLVGDIPEIAVRGTEFAQEDGRNILLVKVHEKNDRLRAKVDNYGTERFGPIRARVSGEFKSVVTDADQIGLSIRTNPVDLSEIFYVSGYYETAIGTNGLRMGVAASVGNTAPESRSGNGDRNGDSFYLSAITSYPLARSTAGSLWLEAEGAYLTVDQDELGSMIRDDTSVTVSLGLRSELPLLGGRMRTRSTIVRGLGVFGATRLGDPLASRRDGDGVFTKGVFWTDFRTGLSKNVEIYFSGKAQIADRPLLSTEELSIGGAYRVRGYDFSELSGDEGFYGLGEVRYEIKRPTPWIRKLQLYAFTDVGYVNDIKKDSSEGSLYSAGPGIRGSLGPVNFELEGAFPINKVRKDSGDKSPHLNMSVGVSF